MDPSRHEKIVTFLDHECSKGSDHIRYMIDTLHALDVIEVH
jgi:hypothetical protein